MSSQPIVINIGALPNDGTGDPLRTAFNDVNLNFANVFAYGPVLSNIQIANNTILTTNTNGNLILNPNGIGVVQANAHVVPDSTRIRNLGSPALRWSTVYADYIDYNGGNITFDNLTIPGNIQAGGYVSAVGNVSGAYIFGNGSQLTGINASSNKIFNGNSWANIDTANGNLVVNTNGPEWTFDATGNLTLPSNLLFQGGESFGVTGANTFTFNNSGRIFTDNVVTILSAGVANANVEIATVQSNGMDLNNWIFDSGVNGNLTLPSNTSSINYANGVSILASSGNVSSLVNGSQTLSLNSDGTVTMPLGSVIKATTDSYTGISTSNGNTFVYVNSGGFYVNTLYNTADYEWQFDNTGNLSIPGGGAVWTLGTAGTAGITANILDPFAVNLGLDYSGNSATLAAGNLVTIQTATGAKSWIFDSAGELTTPQGGRLGSAGKGWTGLDGGNGSPVSLTSFYANGFYAGCLTASPDGNIGITTYTGNGAQGSWTFDNTGNLTTSGNISAVGNVVGGNITGSYLFGNGSQLTGVGAASVPSQNILPTIQSIIIANTSSEYETSGGSGYANVLVANVAPVIEYGVIVTAGSTVDKYVAGNLANIPGTEQITISTGTSDQPFTVYAYVTTNAGTYYSGPEVGFSGLCLLKGTMISLADGTYKPIEDIDNDDLLLTWDFDLGRYAQARPLWIKRGETGTRYNELTFSDGTILRTFDQHRIFNKQAGAFTYPMSDDTPIGTITVNEHGQEITLVKRDLVWDTIEHYNIITNYHINLFADSILTSCRFNNIYPITDMKFVKDVVVNRNLSEFAEIESRFVSGLRLQEQSFELAMITGYVNRLLATEVTESISI